MPTVIIFTLGLLIGSFLNVCIYRIPKGECISYPPSHCTVCNERIKPSDLIPVLSYLLLKGKCRNCGTGISIRYPLTEFMVGLMFLSLYFLYGISFELIKYMILIPFIIVIGIIDLETTDVYLKTTLPGIIAGIVLIIFGHYLGIEYWEFIYGGLLGGALISLIVLITGGMGWGDAEICLLCGLFMGIRLTLLMLFLSFIIGGSIGVILILLRKKSRKDYIPFGPIISLSSLICVYFGENIILWYISLIKV